MLARLDRILDLERELERARMGLLVRIERLFEPERQEPLRAPGEKE